MNYLIDIIVLVIIALFTFIGYKKGLINVAFKLISFVLAIVISLILYKPLSNFIINKTTLDDKLEVTIQDRLSSDVSKEEKDNILSNYYTHAKNASVSVLASNISKTIVNISCVLIVFIISKIILLFFKFGADLIAKLPIIKQFNSVGGFAYGLIKGFLFIYIVLAVVALLAPITNINNIINIINSSIITNIMYNNNLIFALFG